MSRLRDLVEDGESTILTAEAPTVDGGDVAAFGERVAEVASWADAVNATDNPAAHAHASNVAVAVALLRLGIEPVLQVVARDKNRIACQADIVGAALHGVENVCCMTGDDVTAGDEPEARRVFDLDGPQLVRVATGLSEGRYLSGRPAGLAQQLFVGAVENPAAPPLEHRARRAAKKITAGARFLQLQICYHPDRLEAFVRALDGGGFTEQRGHCCRRSCSCAARAPCRSWTTSVPGIDVPAGTIEPWSDRLPIRAEAAYELALEQARAGAVAPWRARAPPDRLSSRRCRLAALPRPRHPHQGGEATRMHTVLSSRSKQVTIGPDQPFCIIGERINPTGRKAFAEALRAGDLSEIVKDVEDQVAMGAHVLDVNMGVPLTDEADLLRRAVMLVQEHTRTCRSASTPRSSRRSRPGSPPTRARRSSTRSRASDDRLERVLPLVKEHGAGDHLPRRTTRPASRRRPTSVSKCAAGSSTSSTGEYEIPMEDIVIDPLAMTVGADPQAVVITLETISRIRDEFGLNMTLGASNTSFGLPGRHALNAAFLADRLVRGPHERDHGRPDLPDRRRLPRRRPAARTRRVGYGLDRRAPGGTGGCGAVSLIVEPAGHRRGHG